MTDITYLFHLQTKWQENYYLTNATQNINYQKKDYLPYSNLEIKMAEFNDSAINQIIIKGIYEQGGIESDVDLVGSSVKIYSQEHRSVKLLFTYLCTKQKSENLAFEIICQPETIKLNQSLLPVFSKKCRANFGDAACGLNINDFSDEVIIKEVKLNWVICKAINRQDGYFTNGKISLRHQQGLQRIYKIKTQIKNKLELFEIINFSLYDQQAILTAGCDKMIGTCCYSFDNAVNFRGEPNIPEHSIIKN